MAALPCFPLLRRQEVGGSPHLLTGRWGCAQEVGYQHGRTVFDIWGRSGVLEKMLRDQQGPSKRPSSEVSAGAKATPSSPGHAQLPRPRPAPQATPSSSGHAQLGPRPVPQATGPAPLVKDSRARTRIAQDCASPRPLPPAPTWGAGGGYREGTGWVGPPHRKQAGDWQVGVHRQHAVFTPPPGPHLSQCLLHGPC